MTWTAALAGALRIFGAGWNMITTPVHTAEQAGSDVIRSLGLPEHPELLRLGERLTREEMERRPYDRTWVLAFVATLFAIHVGRMQAEWTLIGLLGPVVAAVGDLAAALLIGFGVIGPARLAFRKLTRPLEHLCWMRVVGPRDSTASPRWLARWIDRLLRPWLTRRLRIWIRLRQMRYSLSFSIERGLQMGLPIVAVAVATVPIWGMSWYFNSENWAAAIYNSWAEQRTDAWRTAMVRAVRAAAPGTDLARAFTLAPPGLAGDFAFLVIGDPGEGDASQHILRDQIIRADVRFMVISSDVVFAATFFAPEAASAAMRARVESDHRLTSTTDSRIAWLVGEAARLRREYGVPTGFQQAPYFQIQTERFALLAVDTGVLRGVDPDQIAWLRAGLEQSRGKFTMAILGHPCTPEVSTRPSTTTRSPPFIGSCASMAWRS